MEKKSKETSVILWLYDFFCQFEQYILAWCRLWSFKCFGYARTSMGCRQCLPLSVVHLKGKHCRKPHCRNGVVNTFRHDVCNSDFNWPKLKKDLITVQHVWYKTSYQRKLGPGMAFLSQSEPDLVQEVNFWLTKKIDRLNMTIFVLHLCHCWRWNMCKFSKKKAN